MQKNQKQKGGKEKLRRMQERKSSLILSANKAKYHLSLHYGCSSLYFTVHSLLLSLLASIFPFSHQYFSTIYPKLTQVPWLLTLCHIHTLLITM